MTPRTIRKIVSAWQAWRRRQKLYRAIPDMLDLDRELERDRRRHRAGAQSVIERKRELLHGQLAMELGR